MKRRILFLMFALSVTWVAQSVNYFGDVFSFKQPNGSFVDVKVYGNEFYQDVESIDGYTLIRDEKSNEICYALLSSNGKEYASSGIKYAGGVAPKAIAMITNPHVRISKESIKEKENEQKKQLGFDETKQLSPILELRAATALPDTVYGITILIDFKDVKSDFTKEQIERFCNGDNYNEFGNSCSVKEYFQRISGGKLTYLNYVTDFITMPENKDYYDCIADSLFFSLIGTDKGRLEDVLNRVSKYIQSNKQIGVSQLTDVRSAMVGDEYKLVNILYAGYPECGWSNGLWPHMSTFGIELYANRGYLNPYQISNLGDEISVGTFIHESAHLLCGWPDFYSYDGVETNNNIYGLGTQFIGTKTKNPLPPSPLCLDWMGWLNKTDITNFTEGEKVTLKNEIGDAAVYYKKGKRGESDECYYLEVRRTHSKGYHREYDLDGLFVWHVNEYGNNQLSSQSFGLQQEDCRPATYFDPCFKKGLKSELNDYSNPSALWDDGKKSGLDIWDISEVGEEMTFRCGHKSNEILFGNVIMEIGFVGQFYSSQLTAISNSSIVDKIQFRLIDGELPKGLSMNSQGLISGCPKVVGDYDIVVEAFASDELSIKDTFSIHILSEGELVKDNEPYPIPGIVESEDFMKGGEGLAYHDWTETNSMNDTIGVYRPDDDVDIFLNRLESFSIRDFELVIIENIGVYMEKDEWLRYYVHVDETSDYLLKISYDDVYDQTMRDFKIYLDDSLLIDYEYIVDVTDDFADNKIKDYCTTYFTVHLSEGNHILKLVADRDMAFNQIEFKKENTGSVVFGDSMITIPGELSILDFDKNGIKDLNGIYLEHLNNCPDRIYRPHEICKHFFNFEFFYNNDLDLLVDYTVSIKDSNWYFLSNIEKNEEDITILLDGKKATFVWVENFENEELMVYLPSGIHTLTLSDNFFAGKDYIKFVSTFIEPNILYDTIHTMVADCGFLDKSENVVMDAIINYFPYTVETRGLGADSVKSGLPSGLFLDRIENLYYDTYDYVLKGLATEVGEFDFEVILKDSVGNSFRDTIHLIVDNWEVTFPKERLVVNEWYEELLPVCGLKVQTRGLGKDSINSGLPEGITLNLQHFLYGYPKEVGEYTFELIGSYVIPESFNSITGDKIVDSSIVVIRDTLTMVVHDKTKLFSTTHILPCAIEAENFDLGGEGAAYHLEENFSGVLSDYREDSVEIVKNENGYSLMLRPNEWFVYSFEVKEEGFYNFRPIIINNHNYCNEPEVAVLNHAGEEQNFHTINLSCTNSKLFYLIPGEYKVQLRGGEEHDNRSFYIYSDINIDKIVVDKVSEESIPYSDIPVIPGVINLLEFDRYLGCFDKDCENKGGVFRQDESVDIYENSNGKYEILMESYENLEYTVKINPNSSGEYRVTIPIYVKQDYFIFLDSELSLTIKDEVLGERVLGEVEFGPEDTVCSFDISISPQICKSGRDVKLKLESYAEDIYVWEMIIEETANHVDDIEANRLKLYPNPTKDEFTINVETEGVSLEIFNSQGGLVEEYDDIPQGEFRFGGNLVSGIYIVEIHTQQDVITHKIVKL